MSLFRGLRGVEPVFNVQKAVMTIVVAAIKADGDVSEEEIGRLRAMCIGSSLFASNTKEEDDAVINFADNVTAQLKRDAIVKASAALTPELRETAFAFACEMVLADGIVGDAEDACISMLAEILGISEEIGRMIIEVTMIRTRGAA